MEENNIIHFKIGKEDLKASKILYQNKLFSQSVFYLQQSVEKIHKYWGIYIKIIQSNELKKHITSLIYDKTVEAGLKDGIDNNYEEIKKSNIEKKYWLHLSENDIKYYISEEKNNKNITYRNINKIQDNETSIEEIKSIFANILGPEINEFNNLNIKSLKNRLTRAVLYTFIGIRLNVLSHITQHHAVHARYYEDKIDPLHFYIETLPLINKLNELFNLLEEIILIIESLIKHIKNE